MKDFTKGPEGSAINLFAIPILLGSVFMQFYNIVNSAVVGRFLGKEALAAVGSSYPIIFLLVSVVIGIGSGGTVLVSQYLGAGDKENVKKTIDTTYLFLLISSIILTVIGVYFTPTIFRLINLPEEVFADAVNYFKVYLFGLVFMFGFNAISSVLRGMGDSKTPLYYLIGSNVLNLILSVVFIGVLHLKVEFSAWASVISQGTAFLALNFHMRKTNGIASIHLRRMQWNRAIFNNVIRIGLPTGIQQSFVALGQVALMSIVNSFGTPVIAAYSAVMRLDSFATMPAMNFSQALTTFAAQNLGANKTARVRRGLYSVLKTNICISIGIAFCFFLFGNQLMSLFTFDQEVIAIGNEFLIICGAFYSIFSIMFIFTGLFRGAGDTLAPMFITLFSLWLIRIPVAYILSNYLGYTGIWISIPIGWFFGAIGSIIYYKKGNWRNKVVVKQVK